MHTVGGSISTAVLESSVKMGLGVELIGNPSGTACISCGFNLGPPTEEGDVVYGQCRILIWT